jgi:hypothetical protein
MVQVVEHLATKCKDMSSNPSTAKKKKNNNQEPVINYIAF